MIDVKCEIIRYLSRMDAFQLRLVLSFLKNLLD